MSQTTAAGPRSKGLLTPHAGAPVTVERRFPGEAAAAFARHYWLPRWRLTAGTDIRQAVLEYPTANLVVEPDAVLLHRASRGLSTRTLRGEGWAFGVMLRPGTARGWTGASLRGLPAALPATALVPEAAAAIAAASAPIRERMDAGDDSGAIDAFEAAITGLPAPGADAELVDAIVATVEDDRELLRVEQLADRFDLSVRSLQRLVAGHIGFGPKWLIQRYRLQEAAAALRSDAPPPIGLLAAELGYADQAHFTREFRAVVGSTPGAYAAQVAAEREAAR
ncbi:helix-turn-helix domain-containing protein [Leifsonia sp. NPDC080035]|uniref:Helix-turn-helix domain-containing protein n=1 Tax=Leifsonia sp. NPDC080035 TaxID=3143936 RepID=A0AAU7G7P9_9MICO